MVTCDHICTWIVGSGPSREAEHNSDYSNLSPTPPPHDAAEVAAAGAATVLTSVGATTMAVATATAMATVTVTMVTAATTTAIATVAAATATAAKKTTIN